MEEFFLKMTERLPEIQLREGFVSIKGHSIPREPKKIYKPVLQWVKDYTKDPAPRTEVLLNIDFCDTDSIKVIFEILKLLAMCQKTNRSIVMVFYWIYKKEDRDIKELGEFFENKLQIIFNYSEE